MAQSVSAFVGRLAKAFAFRDVIELGDADLLQRFRSTSDAVAFEAIVRRHGPMVLGVCQRLLRNPADADDAFQATFAILIRRAGSLTRPERLAGWLSQVAYRTAKRARAVRQRRTSTQTALPEIPVESPVAEIVWRELRHIFDEEVNRLPDKLRLPVVMCFLEGQTKRAAARSLGWPEGTFSCRLQQARELLQSRLSRRGVTLSAGALALALFEGTASAAVSPALVSSTVQSVSLIAAGSALTGPVAALTQGVLQSMVVTKMKIVAAVILTVGMLGGGTGWVVRNGSGDATSALAAEPTGKPAAPTQPSGKSTDPEILLKAARARAEAEQAENEWLLKRLQQEFVKAQEEVQKSHKELLNRRDQLLTQQRELDDQIAKLKLDAVRQANRNTPEVGRDLGINLTADAQQREIERLKKVVADLEAQNAGLRDQEADQRKRADAQRDQSRAQEMLAKQNVELEAAETQLKLKEAKLEQIKRVLVLDGDATNQKQIDEMKADLDHARAVVAHLRGLLVAQSGGRAVYDKGATPDVRVAEAEVKQREAELQAAEAKLQLRKKNHERIARLVEAKTVDNALLDEAEANLAVAKAEIAQAHAGLERAKAILDQAHKEADRKVAPNQPAAIDKEIAEIEAKLQQLLKLKDAGIASEAEVDKARIAATEARIRSELGILVGLRQREVARAKQLFEAQAIGPDEYKKAVDALDSLKRWQAQWK
jgi:RNA polymerase sigma factor (sigma-70 family)